MKKTNQEAPKVIERDLTDGVVFDGIAQGEKMQQLLETSETEGLARDTFAALHQNNPKVVEEAPLTQRGIIEQMMKLPEYQQLRGFTQGDDVSSGLGTLQFAPELCKQYQEIQKKVEERTKQAKEKGEKAPESLEEALDESEMSVLRQALRRGAEEATEKADEWDSLVQAWGIEPGDIKQIPPEERLAMADQLMKSGKLKGVADLCGRFKNVVNASQAITKSHGFDEIVDVGMGSDLNRVVPTELLKLDQSPGLFYKDMLEGSLNVYNMRGVEHLGKGPVIFCHDKSGSMYGSRDSWATAVAVALMSLCEKQKRAFGYVAFDTRVMVEKFFPKNELPRFKDKIEIAQIDTAGGTDFYPALMQAFAQRKKDPDFKPSDIVFCTDGEFRMSPEQLREVLNLKKETDVRIFGIAIVDGGRPETTGSTLEAFCDQIAVVNSLGEIETIREMVQKTASDSKKKGRK